MAARHDLNIDQGSTYTRDFIYKGSDGTPIDLTNFTARMMIRKAATSSDVIFDTDDEAGSLVIVGVEGKITLSLTDEVTAALPAPFVGKYDIEIKDVDGGGIVTRLVQGNLTIDPNVTRT